MKVATFNVNGVKGRLPRILEWLDETKTSWTDSARHLHPHGRKELYTFWVNDDAFRRNAGFRMNFLLLSPSLVGRLAKAEVDVGHRGREKPSDHTPVGIELT